MNQNRNDEFRCTTGGVRNFLKKQQANSNIVKTSKKRNEKRCLGTEELIFIDTEVNKDRELSAAEIQPKLEQKFRISVSRSVIQRERQKLGWVTTKTKYCQMVRHENKEKRLQFCLDFLFRGDTFDDVIFIDECIVRCEHFTSRRFRRKE